MENFCYELIKFLESEYPDYYTFKLEKNVILQNFELSEFILTINITSKYKLVINEDSLRYIYNLYVGGEYIKERELYVWQKELIDIIEGS